MQREDPDGIVIVCDFCRRDWDGQEPMIEGHHGSVICLVCTKKALVGQAVGEGKYSCTLCLRFNIAPEMPRWSNPEQGGGPEGGDPPPAIICQECLYQAAKAFHKNKDVDFRWDPVDYPPPVKSPKIAKEEGE